MKLYKYSMEESQLIELIKKMPGIGPRQASRIIFFLASSNANYRKELQNELSKLFSHAKICSQSFQTFFSDNISQMLSPLSLDTNRNKSQLMIIKNNEDITAIEKTKKFFGQYFVLGGVVPAIDSFHNETKKRILILKESLKKRKANGLCEIILALPVTRDGERTETFLLNELNETLQTLKISYSKLAKGVSTGTEIEYIDRDTFSEAFDRRR
jgi:recombination protein RecR